MANLTLVLAWCLTMIAHAEQYKLSANLDALIKLPEAYKITPEHLEREFGKGMFQKNPYFEWLSEHKDRAIFKRSPASNITVDLTILNGEIPIEELIIDFDNGKFLGVTVSIYNRGDGGSISDTEFLRRFSATGKHLAKQLDTRPRKRDGNIRKGVMTDGYTWSSPRGKAVLLCNPDVGNYKQPEAKEFIRMRLARKDAKGIYQAALQERSQATVRKSRLVTNVRKNDGYVYIHGIPMVDQGNKGYCVVASAQRLFEYYGIACDMHQLAQLAKSDPNRGTNALYINQQLGRIDYLFKTRFKCLAVSHDGQLVELKDDKYVGKVIPRRSYDKFITSNIDKGIPLLWALELGIKPESPQINLQTSGGHMRMIHGYNKAKNEIVFTDSWGAGNDFKTMNADDAHQVTRGLYVMTPTTN
ncbi:MAG: C39 family peptidase [Akkermansiaceae bacterium]